MDESGGSGSSLWWRHWIKGIGHLGIVLQYFILHICRLFENRGTIIVRQIYINKTKQICIFFFILANMYALDMETILYQTIVFSTIFLLSRFLVVFVRVDVPLRCRRRNKIPRDLDISTLFNGKKKNKITRNTSFIFYLCTYTLNNRYVYLHCIKTRMPSDFFSFFLLPLKNNKIYFLP